MRSNKFVPDRFVATQKVDHELDRNFNENIIYKLEIFIGESTLTYDLKTGRYLIGRTDNCDIEIIDQSVSRRHAMIEVTPDGSVFIEDLGSANKTFKNGTELRENVVYDIPDGSALKFGLVNAKLSIDSNSPSIESNNNQSQHSNDDLFGDVSMTESITDDAPNDSNENSNEADQSNKENVDNNNSNNKDNSDNSQSFLEYDKFLSMALNKTPPTSNNNLDYWFTSTPARKPLENRSINLGESSRESMGAVLADTVVLADQSERSVDHQNLSIGKPPICDRPVNEESAETDLEEEKIQEIDENTDKKEDKLDFELSITQRICENLTARSSESFESDFYEERTQAIPVVDNDDRVVFAPTQIVTGGTTVDFEPDSCELATQPLQLTQPIVDYDQQQISIIIDRLEIPVDIDQNVIDQGVEKSNIIEHNDREMNQSTVKRKRGRPKKLLNSINQLNQESADNNDKFSPGKSIMNDEKEKEINEKKSLEIGESSKENTNSVAIKPKEKPEKNLEKKKRSQSANSIKNKKSTELEKLIQIKNNKFLEQDKSTKIEMEIPIEIDKSRTNSKVVRKKSSIKNNKLTECEKILNCSNTKLQEIDNGNSISINKSMINKSPIKIMSSESETTIKIERNKSLKNKKSSGKKNIEQDSKITNKKDNLIETESIKQIENRKSSRNKKSLEKKDPEEIVNEISLKVNKLIPNKKSAEKKSSIINSKFTESEEITDIENTKSQEKGKPARNKKSVERKSSIKNKKSIEFEDKRLIKDEKLVGFKKPRGKQGVVKNQSQSVDFRQNVIRDKSCRKRARSSLNESVNQYENWEDTEVFKTTSAKRSRLSKFELISFQKPQPGTDRQLRRRWSYRNVVFTGIPVTKQSEKTILALRGHLVNDDISMVMLDANQTVLVTDCLRRTVKFMCCLAKGIPIVSLDWLEKCASCNRFVDPRPYILKTKSDTCNIDLTSNLELAEYYHNTAGGIMALHKCIVFITDNTKPNSNQMQQIISSAGGKMLLIQDDSFYEHLEDKDSTHICITDSDLTTSKIPDLLERFKILKDKKIEILSTDFILTMIMDQEWPEFETYRVRW